MSLPARWNPFRQSNRFEPFADMEGLFRGFGLQSLRDQNDAMDLRTDITEDEKAYRVEMDMPGVKKEDIEVSVEGNEVAVKAEIKRSSEGGNGRKVHAERYSGQIYRSLSLPHEFDNARCEAHYQDGVLSLVLPKKPGAESKRLPIN